MSLEMSTFVESIDDSVVPAWIKRLDDLGMVCEIHPEFSFSSQTGFLPFKLGLKNPAHQAWSGKQFLTGFEFYFDEFNLQKHLEQLNPKPSGMKKFFGPKPSYIHFASEELDIRLAKCSKEISFVWGSADTFELRMATTSAAILAELTGGICFYPPDGIWYENAGNPESFAKDAQEYEASLKPRELRTHEFEAWL